jgi:hypothetical protein
VQVVRYGMDVEREPGADVLELETEDCVFKGTESETFFEEGFVEAPSF